MITFSGGASRERERPELQAYHTLLANFGGTPGSSLGPQGQNARQEGGQLCNTRSTRAMLAQLGLALLLPLKGLRVVELRSTRVTNAGLTELKAALPDCLILD